MLFLIPLVILLIMVIIRLLPKKRHEFVVDMSYDEMINNVRSFALSMRAPARVGAGVSVGPSRRRLERAYRILSNRVRSGGELYEFEKQIYENYHLVRKLLEKSLYKAYSTLPHKRLNPRVVSLATFIVSGCNRRLEKNKVVSVVKAFNMHTPLHYRETAMLKSALLYVLTQEMSNIAAKSIHYYRMKQAAEFSKTIHPEYYLSDSYLYYYIQKWGDPSDSLLIKNSDIIIENVESSFVSALISNSVIVGNIAESIRNIDSVIDDNALTEITPSHHLMAKDQSYNLMDIDSIKAYLKRVGDISDDMNVSEKAVVEASIKLNKESGIHFGEFLFGNTRRLRIYVKRGKDKGKNSPLSSAAVVYVIFTFFISIIAGLLFGFFSGLSLTLRILLGVLIGLAFIKTAEHLFSFFVKYEHKFMPKMGYKIIPPEGESEVVISELLYDSASVKKAMDHLELISRNTSDVNVNYLLLADLKESDKETDPSDAAIISELDSRLKLSGNTRINVVVRKRTEREGKYSGYERKRGALMELSCAYMEGEDNFLYKGKELKKPEFLILLDADNELLPGAVRRAINAMLHPLNEKYDLLTFGCAVNMHSVKTFYSKRFLSSCGIPDYGKSSDYIYDMTRSSIFCGKGIVRLKPFYNKLKDIFPENRILSHDIIEGAILNTGALQERVYEDAPSSVVSDIERRSRWIRGDYQLLPYIFKKKGIEIKELYRYILFSNVLGALTPAIFFGLLASAIILGNEYLWMLLGIAFLLSPSLDFLGALRGFTSTVRTRYVLKDIAIIIKDIVYKLLMLPFYAVNGLYLFILTLWRLIISKKNLLEWKTYGSVQGATKFNRYVRILTLSFIVTAITAFFIRENLVFLIYIALYYLFSLLEYTSGRELPSPTPLSTNREAELMMYAEDIYKYFHKYLKKDTNYLIPDNYQCYPYKGDRHSTSPSNIGLSLVALIAAVELEIILPERAAETAEKIISTLEKLKKWNGNLYNWYDTVSLEVLYPYYVSSVDSANLLACLFTLKQFLIKHNLNELSERVDSLIFATDLKALYDSDRDLFYIGFNEATGDLGGHYDLMASEARILSYVYSAINPTIVHWMKLSRECVALRGNTLVSWSGTAFEYLMPELFLPTAKDSLVGRSIKNVVMQQIKERVHGMWGISEGGYYRFDDQMNYEYKAFGLRELSLRSDYNRAVVTPYSSFLALPFVPRAASSNLSNLRSRNMYGEYGFYEALDMYSGEKPVTSFMAHHLGMSIAAIANVLKDGAIKKYFLNNVSLKAARLLLTELPIRDKFVNVKDDALIYADKKEKESVKILPIKAKPTHNLLSNGNYAVLVDDYGKGYSVSNGIMLNKYRSSYDTGVFALIKEKNSERIFSPTYAPVRQNVQDYNVVFSPEGAIYHNKTDNVSVEITVPPCFNGEIRKYNYYNKSDETVKLKICIYAELNLNTLDRDFAHPVFNDMFIVSEYIKEKGAITFKRKNLEGGALSYAAALVKGLDNLKPDTDRMSFIGRGRDICNPKALSDDYNPNEFSMGEPLYPCIGFIGEAEVKGKSNLEFYAVFMIACNREKIESMLNDASSNDFLVNNRTAAKVSSVNYYSKCVKTPYGELRNLIDSLIVGPGSQTLKNADEKEMRSKLARLGLSPDKRYVLIEYRGSSYDSLINQYIGMLSYIMSGNLRSQMIIIYNDESGYHRDTAKYLEEILWSLRGHDDYPILINRADIDDDMAEFIGKLSSANAGKLKYDNTANCTSAHTSELIAKPLYPMNIEFISGEGAFLENGAYAVRPLNSVPLLPYSNVIGMKYGGTVVTDNGGGYTFGLNSREEKLSVWYNDPVTDRASERLYLITSRGQLRINTIRSGMAVIHSPGITEFNGKADDITIKHSQYMIRDGKIKVYDTMLELRDKAQTYRDITLALDIIPSLGWRESNAYYTERINSDTLKFTNASNSLSLVLKVFKGSFVTDDCNVRPRDTEGDKVTVKRDKGESATACAAYYRIRVSGSARLVFLLGADTEDIKQYNLINLDEDKEAAINYFKTLNPARIDSSDKALDIFFNNWLMYQIVSCRINAKSGYYQSGGATGFRDQLQDHLALLHSNPVAVRAHILKSASHQYAEGDVMHWWHYACYGVRTGIRDDAVFLVYATSEYISATGDESILKEQIPYLISDRLRDGERSRLEVPLLSDYTEPLLIHLERALEYSLRLGEHDLVLIGGGDWNDALDAVGRNNKGESVWLTQFTYMTLKKFMIYLDTNKRLKYSLIADKLKAAVNGAAWDGKWYRRVFTDEGEWLGSAGSEYMKMDLLTQAFSLISEIAEGDKGSIALESAYSLIDLENGLIKLLDPPFEERKWYGYISAYPSGVRENGGQYTHAAVWYVIALLKAGMTERAYELIKMLNPAEKLTDIEFIKKYMGEPYAMPADIYYKRGLKGRMGWNFYTGSAGWYYKLILEELAGIKMSGGALNIKPVLPAELKYLNVEYRYRTSLYKIMIKRGNKDSMRVDGVEVVNGGVVSLIDDGKVREIVITIRMFTE